MKNVLRYFYCGAILLAMHTATYSMDGLNLSERNELNQQALQVFMDKTQNVQKERTAQFFEPYKSTSWLGERCSKNPTSGCFLLMHHAVSNRFPTPDQQHIIATDIKEVPVDNFPLLCEEFYTALRKQNKPS